MKVVKRVTKEIERVGSKISKATEKAGKDATDVVTGPFNRQREIGARRALLGAQGQNQATVVPVSSTLQVPASLGSISEQRRNLFVEESASLYIESMNRNSVYGGDIEIRTISEIFRRPIEVWSRNRRQDGSITYDRNEQILATPSVIENQTPIRLLLTNANGLGAHYSTIRPNFTPDTASRSTVEPECISIPGDGNCLFSACYVGNAVNGVNLAEVLRFLPDRASELRQGVCLQLGNDPILLRELFNNILTRALQSNTALGDDLFGELPRQDNLIARIHSLLLRYYPQCRTSVGSVSSRSDSDASQSSSSTLDEFESLGIHQHLLSFDKHDSDVLDFLNNVSEEYIKSFAQHNKVGGEIELYAIASMWDCKIDLSVYQEKVADIKSVTKPIYEALYVKDNKDKHTHPITISLQLVEYGSENARFIPTLVNNDRVDLSSAIESGNVKGIFNALAIARKQVDPRFDRDADGLSIDIANYLKTITGKYNRKCPPTWNKQDNIIADCFKSYIYATNDDSNFFDLLAECPVKDKALQYRNVRKLLMKIANELVLTVTQQVKEEIATWYIPDAITPTHLELSSSGVITVTTQVPKALYNLQVGCGKFGKAIASTGNTLYTNATRHPVNFIYMTVTSAMSLLLDFAGEFWSSSLPAYNTIATSIVRALNFTGTLYNVYGGFIEDIKHARKVEKAQYELLENLPFGKMKSLAFITNNEITKIFNENDCKNLSKTKFYQYWDKSDKIEFALHNQSKILSITRPEIGILRWLYERWSYALLTISAMAEVAGTAVTLTSLQKQLTECNYKQEHDLRGELLNDSDISSVFNVTDIYTTAPTIDCASALVTPPTVYLNLTLTGLSYVLWNYTQITGPSFKHDLEITNTLTAIIEEYKARQDKIPEMIANMLSSYNADTDLTRALIVLPNDRQIKRGVRKTIELLKKHVEQIEKSIQDGTTTIESNTQLSLNELKSTIAKLTDKNEIYSILGDKDASLALFNKTIAMTNAIEAERRRSSTAAGQPTFRRLSSSLLKVTGALTFFNHTKGRRTSTSSKLALADKSDSDDEANALINAPATSAQKASSKRSLLP